MTQAEKRQVAIGAVRSEMRHMHLVPSEMSADDALAVLDDLTRQHPSLTASQWYINASEAQIKLFEKEWGK